MNKNKRNLAGATLLLSFGAALAGACSTTSATQPEAMSAAAHRAEANKHEARAAPDVRLARQHAAAARELEQYTEAECGKFDAFMRRQCPLLYVVVAVEDVPGGARMKLREGTSLQAVMDHMRCHHAFGRHHAFAGMPECPLYLNGVEFRAEQPASIVIASSDEAVVEEIRDRARDHLPRAPKASRRTYSPWSSGIGNPSVSLPGL